MFALRQSDREALVKAFECDGIVVCPVVNYSNVVQYTGDRWMLVSSGDLINSQRLLITFLGKFKVTKSLVVAAHIILRYNCDIHGVSCEKLTAQRSIALHEHYSRGYRQWKFDFGHRHTLHSLVA